MRRDFPGRPVVKTLPSSAEGECSIPGLGARIPHVSGPKNQSIKQKQYCNKFIRDLKKKNPQWLYREDKRGRTLAWGGCPPLPPTHSTACTHGCCNLIISELKSEPRSVCSDACWEIIPMPSLGRVKCMGWEGRCQAGDLLHTLEFIPTSICIPHTVCFRKPRDTSVSFARIFSMKKVSMSMLAPFQEYLLHLYHHIHWSLQEDRKNNGL